MFNLNPFAIEYYEDELYFSDSKFDAIWKLALFSPNSSGLTQVRNFSFDPTAIRVVDLIRQPTRLDGSKWSKW